MSYWGYGGYGHGWGRGYGVQGFGTRGWGYNGFGGASGSGLGGWSHFPGQRDLPAYQGFYSNYVDNWGNDSPQRIGNWGQNLTYENAVRRSNLAQGLDWNQANSNNLLRNSLRRMHNEAAVDSFFRRY
jgi:hypothetical protein